jgi:uncharacterized protein
VASEPDMETLLASIRKAIHNDLNIPPTPETADKSLGRPFKGSMAELRVKFDQHPARNAHPDDEIRDLRNKINRNRAADIIAEPAHRFDRSMTPFPSRKGFAAILAGDLADKGRPSPSEPVIEPMLLRPSLVEREPSDEIYQQGYEEPQSYNPENTWDQPDPSYLPVVQEAASYENYEPQPLLSEDATLAASGSFNELAESLMTQAMGERSIEDVTQDMLRGMLKSWLDANLPSLVERLVREEIERVARRGQ